MKILIVGGDTDTRRLLKKKIEASGHRVRTARDEKSAWRVLREKTPVSIALIDEGVKPEKTLAFCEAIRREFLAEPPLLILMASADAPFDDLPAGVDDLLQKPVAPRALSVRIESARRRIERQAMLSGLLNAVSSPICLKDENGIFRFCNSAYAELTGKKPAELLGRTEPEVIPKKDKACAAHEQDLKLARTGVAVTEGAWTHAADGREIFLDTEKKACRIDPVGRRGVAFHAYDSTRYVRMEEELRHLAVAVEQSAEAVMIMNPKGRVIYVNSGFETMTGYAREEMIGRSPEMLSAGRQSPSLRQKLKSVILEGTAWEGHLLNRKKNGALFDAEVMLYPVRNDTGEVQHHVALLRDVTLELAMEKQLRRTHKTNALGELAGGVAHDFNNILTAVLGYVALCMNTLEREHPMQGYLQEIVCAGERATKLVRQILTFSRQEETEFRPVVLQSLIRDSLGLAQTMIRENVTVETLIADDCGPVSGDPTQLQQVMVNLLVNAIHALGEKPGRIRVSLQAANLPNGNENLAHLAPGIYARLEVADSGCGMPPQTMERIFEPHYTTKKSWGGTGFGLFIVRNIVQKHRGDIVVESEENAGSLFGVYLPLHEENNPPNPSSTPPSSVAEPKCRGKILLVDDDEIMLSMGSEILKSFGYSVVAERDPAKAVKLFRSAKKPFSALVSDCKTPYLDNCELRTECRRFLPNLPVALYGEFLDETEKKSLRESSLDVFLTKPVDWRALNRFLQERIPGTESDPVSA